MTTPTEKLYELIDTLLTSVRVLAALRYGPPRRIKPAQGELLHILANGPSLKKLTVGELQGDKLALNLFASTHAYLLAKPAHYVLLSPAFWPSGPEQQAGKPHLQTLRDIVEKTTWPMVLYVPRKSGGFIPEKVKGNTNVHIQYYADTPVEGFAGICHRFYDWQLGMPRPHNVLIPSIMIGIWAGYKSIQLHGVDHSWLPLLHVDEHNNALLEQRHFYDAGKTRAQPMPIAGNDERRRKLHEILEKFQLIFRAYHTIEAYAKSRDVRIINCTKGSFIDAFERGQPSLGGL
ncbi:MAG: hypothetical protein D6772_14585 [Bacteroidetes bacterium]|nr:MAG: hypothetical protein D6772_14585 [Bacteroidota bacterium]